MEKNEKANQTTNEAAREGRIQTARWTSLTHLKRQITKEKKAQFRAWHEQKIKERENCKSGFYVFSSKAKIDLLLGKAKKVDASRFYQLKVGHGAISTFLKKIRAVETTMC